jgi:hypothetical protein
MLNAYVLRCNGLLVTAMEPKSKYRFRVVGMFFFYHYTDKLKRNWYLSQVYHHKSSTFLTRASAEFHTVVILLNIKQNYKGMVCPWHDVHTLCKMGIIMHTIRVLRPGCLPEKVGVNTNWVNWNLYSHHTWGFSAINLLKPSGNFTYHQV